MEWWGEPADFGHKDEVWAFTVAYLCHCDFTLHVLACRIGTVETLS